MWAGRNLPKELQKHHQQETQERIDRRENKEARDQTKVNLGYCCKTDLTSMPIEEHRVPFCCFYNKVKWIIMMEKQVNCWSYMWLTKSWKSLKLDLMTREWSPFFFQGNKPDFISTSSGLSNNFSMQMLVFHSNGALTVDSLKRPILFTIFTWSHATHPFPHLHFLIFSQWKTNSQMQWQLHRGQNAAT